MTMFKFFCGLFFLVVCSCATNTAQGTVANSMVMSTDTNKTEEYLSLCKQYNLNCLLRYDLKQQQQQAEPQKKDTSKRTVSSYDYNQSNGGIQLIVIAIIIGALLFLWFRFGNGGMFLSSEPSEKKKNKEKPENWQMSEMPQPHQIDSLINQLGAMHNKTEALVILLRHCLIYAADISNTRLARSDTERTALRRLPKSVPNHQNLKELLYVTELAHYGGQDVQEQNFIELLEQGKNFLKQEKTSHA